MGVIAKEVRITEPYQAGFLGFREAEPFKAVIDYAKQHYQSQFPQVLFVDGGGVHHPRGMHISKSYITELVYLYVRI